MVADPILYVVCAAITLAGVPGMLLYAGGKWKKLGLDIVFLAVLWLVIGTASEMTGALRGGFAILVPALGIVMGSGVAAALAERNLSLRIRLIQLAGFSLLLFLPLALIVFGGGGTWLYREIGGLDFAGALPAAVGTGAFLTVVALSGGRSAVGEQVLALRGAMLVAVALLACAVGLELRVDELTPTIALHMLMTPAVAILAAAGIERVKRGRNTREGLAAGTLAGTAAALATSAYLETVTALILGLLAGAVAEGAFRGASAARRLATPLLIGGGIGMLFLGVFSLDVGLVYSGQSTLLAQQAILVALSLVYAVIVSALVFLPFRRRS